MIEMLPISVLCSAFCIMLPIIDTCRVFTGRSVINADMLWRFMR